MNGFPPWIVGLILVLIAGRIFQIWRTHQRNVALQGRPPLGMEATDSTKFRAELRPPILGDVLTSDQTRAPNAHLEHAVDQMADLAARLNPPKTYRHTSPKASANRLVKGIAFNNPVTLFLERGAEQATDNERIILDLFEILDVDPTIIDVSSDSEMHLGIPHIDDKPNLPYLYIGGIAYGGASNILEGVQDGKLVERLKASRITVNTSTAKQLRQL